MPAPGHPARTIPPVTFPDDLPVAQMRETIARAIAEHQVTVIAGETGSGKTTQLPKICLELGRGAQARIGHTQPRRLAARTVAQRIADELKTPLGATVGYQVRFQDSVGEQTAIKLMTDGILLSELQRDRLLRQYDTLIIDEAHERSLNIDFILGYLRQLLPRRPDLKLIITSATIDVERFARHFGGAPVIQVPGRSFPVTTHFLDPEQAADADPQRWIADLVEQIRDGVYGPRGDILIFFAGEREIREQARLLRAGDGLEVLPLYARLSQAEQARVFDLSRRRGLRVVLATNVAETSLTVPGIRYVIDPGEARISRYSGRTRIQRLPIEPISRASADQRQGRCGRVADGVCLRLYSEQDYLQRPEYTDPEIRRTNLAAVILQMLYLRLGDIADFPFLDPPDARVVRDGFRLLNELGAVDRSDRITPLGKQLARLPIDPVLGRMLLAAREGGVLPEVLIIASALAIQDPRERPVEKQQQADQAHARFRHLRSDFMDWLALWTYYEEQRQSLSQNQLRKLCQREFLSFSRMREWRDIHTQLSIACRQQGMRPAAQLAPEPDYAGIHRALLSGLLANIAQQHEGREYLAARNRKIWLFPGSGQHRKPPPWIVAAEIVETAKVYARSVGAIEAEWLLHINPQLLKRHYYEPRWQRAGGRAVAYERVTLFGLTISDKRVVHYGSIDRAVSRELLIREGLIAGRLRSRPRFLRHNLALVAEIDDLEARTRRRDMLAGDEALFGFYDERIPAEITSARHLAQYLKRNPDADKQLQATRQLLLTGQVAADIGEQFPDALVWEGQRYPLSYQFEPGGASDGVSVTVPVALLNRVPRHRFNWLVPGLLREKCIALIRGLPKALRKRLVPAPDIVDDVLPVLEPADVPVERALGEALRRARGVVIDKADWNLQALDAYYRMNLRVVDERGSLLAQGRDMAALITQFRDATAREVSGAGENGPQARGLTAWSIDALPAEWRFQQAGVEIVAYPALVDRGQSADVVLFDYPGEAAYSHRRGVARLLQLQLARPLKQLRKQLLQGNEFNLLLAACGLERDALLEDMLLGATLNAAGLFRGDCRDVASFQAAVRTANAALVGSANEIALVIGNTLRPLAAARPLRLRLADTYPASCVDIQNQLADLLRADFVCDTPPGVLAQYPRYVKAVAQRLERLPASPEKDDRGTMLLAALSEPLEALRSRRSELLFVCDAAAAYWQMLQEFRVSLFAQHLGTAQPVSEKRIRRQWQEVEDWERNHPH